MCVCVCAGRVPDTAVIWLGALGNGVLFLTEYHPFHGSELCQEES